MDKSQEQANLVIRRARQEDVISIVRMLFDDPLGKSRERYEVPIPRSYYEAFEEITQNKVYELVVAEFNGEIVGTLQLMFLRDMSYQGGKRAQLEAVRVDESYRNQGIGKQLLEWAIKRAQEEKCHVLQLTTNKSRLAAQRFYKRLGFVDSHEGMKLDLANSSQQN